MPRPLYELKGPCKALFSDLDGTLTTGGVVEPSTYDALAELGAAGIPVVIVTGRPAGWGQAIMTIAPVAAVVSENGGVTFVRHNGHLAKIYGVPAASLPEWRRRMHAAAVDATTFVPGAKMSSDCRYREVDLAIDWNEEAKLPVQDAEHIVAKLRAAGFAASRSSVHINFGPPDFNKLTACKQVIERVLRGDPDDLEPYVFVGDALNDAPMFKGFSRSVGVANVRDWWDELEHKPAYVTESREGAGVRDVVRQLLGS